MIRKEINRAEVKSSESTDSTPAEITLLKLENLENSKCRSNITEAGVLVWGKKALAKVEVPLITFFHVINELT